MKLKDCTKAELIFVIKRLQLYSLSDGHYIQLALRDVEEEREARKLREARQLSVSRIRKCRNISHLCALTRACL